MARCCSTGFGHSPPRDHQRRLNVLVGLTEAPIADNVARFLGRRP